MAGFVPNQFRARLLEAAVGKTALAAGTVYLGLAVSLPEDPQTTTLANLIEVTTAGYARTEVPAFSPATTVSPVRIIEPTAFQFPALGADMVEPAAYVFLTDAANGTAGLIRYIWTLAQPLTGRFGVPLSVPANTLVVE